MPRYEVIQYKVWQHAISGRIVSIYGASPYTSDKDKPNWKLVPRGFTIRDNRRNTVGMGRKPFTTRKKANAFVAKYLTA